MPGKSAYGSTTVTTSDTELTTFRPKSLSGRATLYLSNAAGGAALVDLTFFMVDSQKNEIEFEITDAEYVAGYTAGITTLAAGSTGKVKFETTGMRELRIYAKCGTSTTLTWTLEE